MSGLSRFPKGAIHIILIIFVPVLAVTLLFGDCLIRVVVVFLAAATVVGLVLKFKDKDDDIE